MSDVREDLWHRCKARIRHGIEAEDIAAWLDPLSLDDLRPDRIVLGGIPNSFFKSRIASRFRPLILDELRDAFPDIVFAANPDLQLQVGIPIAHRSSTQGMNTAEGPGDHRLPDLPPVALTPDVIDNALPLGRPIDATHSKDSFAAVLESPGNREALQFLRQAVHRPGKAFNPLYIVGATGLGKSHLLQHAAKALVQQGEISGHDDFRVLFRTGEAFKNDVLDGITRRAMKPLRDQLRNTDALIVDGLDYLLVSPKAQEELIHTFDILVESGRQVLLSASRFPRALDKMNEALRSRLEMGLLVELGPPDPELRRALVDQRAAEQGADFPEAVAELLTQRITRNLRQLEGAVVRLTAHAALYGEAITVAFAERFAQPYFDVAPGSTGLPVNRESILERVADQFGMTVRSIKGRSRSAKVVSARQVAIHLLRTLGDYSYAEIGATLGHRTHSTIVHAHQQLQSRFLQDARYEGKVMDLARGLGES